jgi:1-acyl-sn-glycerol-3-phosphate acyltransferase
LLTGVVEFLVGAYPRWLGCSATAIQRIYFANHTSHVDTIALWAALPRALRAMTRPVAARDYWGKGLRRYIATKALHAVLIDRTREDPNHDPLEPLLAAIAAGDSLIIFPEGTRGTAAIPAQFKSGLYRLAQRFPQVELVPVYLDNLHRSFPKGAVLPIPISCTVRFGTPLALLPEESKETFLARARSAVIELAGPTPSAASPVPPV